MNTTIKYKYSIIFLDGGKKKTRKVTASNIEHALNMLYTNWACVIEWEELEQINQRFEIPKIENPCGLIEMYEKPIDCSLLPPIENPLLTPIILYDTDILYFGKKHYGEVVNDIVSSDPSYILWMDREIKTHRFNNFVIDKARKQIIQSGKQIINKTIWNKIPERMSSDEYTSGLYNNDDIMDIVIEGMD